MGKFFRAFWVDFNRISATSKVSYILGILGFIVALLTLTATIKSNNLKNDLETDVPDAAKLAKEIADEFKGNPSLAPDFQNMFRDISFKDIVSEVEYEGLDVNVSFDVVAEFDEAFIFGEWYYKVGQYQMNARLSELLITILYKAIEQELSAYLGEIDIETDLLGVADGIPVIKNSYYKGQARIEGFPYYNVNANEMRSMTLIPGQTTLDNEKIAFLRAYFARQQVKKIPMLAANSINIYVKEVDTIGGRKVAMGVKFRLKDLMGEQLNIFERPLYQLMESILD